MCAAYRVNGRTPACIANIQNINFVDSQPSESFTSVP